MKVFNLITGEEYLFGDGITPEHALAQAYCEEHNKSSWYYSHLYNFEKAHQELPFTYGKISVGLGNWACRIA